MKLASISEGWLLQKMREKLGAAGYFNNPLVSQDGGLYNAPSGHDSGSRVAGGTSYATGVPTSPRKRKFLGLANRPNSIVL